MIITSHIQQACLIFKCETNLVKVIPIRKYTLNTHSTYETVTALAIEVINNNGLGLMTDFVSKMDAISLIIFQKFFLKDFLNASAKCELPEFDSSAAKR